MARYTGPVCRLCRREGAKLFLKGSRCTSAACPFSDAHSVKGSRVAKEDKKKVKKLQAPGQHGEAAKKQKSYGVHFREKQKTRRYSKILRQAESSRALPL